MSNLFVRTQREDPAEAELAGHKLLLRAGYIRRVAPGIYSWLPLGLRVLAKVEKVVREEMHRVGAQEVHFPALLPAEPYRMTGRWDDYGPNIFRLQDRRENDYLLAPTHEEMFTLLVSATFSSYKDLPATLYQIQTKYRDEARSRGGLLRAREFIMKDAYSFDVDDAGLDSAYQKQRDAYEKIFSRLDLDYVICSAMSGAMGGSRSEEFLHPSPVGEDTYVVSPGGYVANAEAVTTPPPAPQPYDDLPPARVLPSPDTDTIETLVDLANEKYPREDRLWTAADTLKNVVFATVDGDGNRELVIIGVPGDREVDERRLEAALSPLAVEVATEEDFAAHPELVQGYIGPEVLAPNREDGVRYLTDPRISEGTAWVTGANEVDRHVFGLVCGRDFQVAETIEAAEIHEGDPAPDGSGPLSLHRGIELGHIFQLGRKYSEALGLEVLDQNGKTQVVTMGSYGIGVSRIIAALAESNRDDIGLKWPATVAPYDAQVVIAGKGEELDEAAEALSAALDEAGMDILLDERRGVSAGVKFKDAELLGNPIIVVVGRGVKNGVVEVRNRRTGEKREVPISTAPAEVVALWEELGKKGSASA